MPAGLQRQRNPAQDTVQLVCIVGKARRIDSPPRTEYIFALHLGVSGLGRDDTRLEAVFVFGAGCFSPKGVRRVQVY